MLNSTLYDDVKNCFEEMNNTDNVEETLLKMSRMDVTSEVLEATNAPRLIMNYFYQSTCGDLARRLAMDWLRIRTPKMPELLLKRKAKMGDSIEHKKIRISEDEENISSVFSITEDNEEEVNPIPAKERIPSAPTVVEVAKPAPLPAASSLSFFTRLTTKPAEDYGNEDGPAVRIAHAQREAEEWAARNRQASSLDASTSSTSYPTPSPEKTVEERIAKEIEEFEAKKGQTKPAPAAASNASGASHKKTADETRFAEVTLKVAQKKAEKDATQRKTVVIPDHDYAAKSRRSKKEFK